MRKILLSILGAFLAGSTFAGVLTPQEALNNALTKLNKGTAAAKGAASNSMTLSYTENGTGETPLYYVFNQSTGGFIIAGADSRSTGLLGYTDNGDFATAKENPAFQDWLTECTEALQWLSEQDESVTSSESSITELTTSVAPLLTCKWNQGSPYNTQCPKLTSGSYPATGCTATAAAQVMYFYKWPSQGTGSHTNTNNANQSADFGSTTYNWGVMKDTYAKAETGAAADAVALLMNHLGCAFDMKYDTESSASIKDIYQGITTYFKYDKSASLKDRSYYTTTDWNTLLRAELDQGRPIIMGAHTSKGTGHAFILDGYDTNGYYHVNWGWSGSSNGYFDVNYMYPHIQGIGGSTGGGYNIDQQVITGIQKDIAGTSIGVTAIEISKQLDYNSGTGKFSFSFLNNGLGEFTGQVGFIVVDTDNKIVSSASAWKTYEKSPIVFNKGEILEFSIPSTATIARGYYMYPCYRLSSSDNWTVIPCKTTANRYLTYQYPSGSTTLDWVFYTSSLPMLSYSNVRITRNYTGYAPKFKVDITNNSQAKVGYNMPISVFVYKKTTSGTTTTETNYCIGKTALYLEPGNTKTVEIECCQDGDYKDAAKTTKYTYLDLTTGNYYYKIDYNRGTELYYLLKEGSISMQNPGNPHITYSGFNLNKKEIKQGEDLTVSFDAKNAGGFYSTEYRFWIYPETSSSSVGYLPATSVDIAGGSTTTPTVTPVSITGTITLDPGYYEGQFKYKDGSNWVWMKEGGTFGFNVTAATANDEVSSEQDNKADVIYDVTGRRVQSMKKGGLYIVNGRKVIY